MLSRNLTPSILDSLADTPVVFVAGPRQVGKTTLVRAIAASDHPAGYATLDDLTTLTAARTDPTGFVQGLSRPAVIDEVQRVGDLLLAIKAVVDRDRWPGSFLLTGSANVLTLPRVSDALVGRMAVRTLWPLSQGELAGTVEDFISAAFSDVVPMPPTAPIERDALIHRIVMGGYPEVQTRDTPARRGAWFDDYLTTLLQRDVRDIAAVADLTQLPRLLSLLATRLGGTVSASDLSRMLAIPHSTLSRYLALLESLFLVYRLPAWSRNLGTRLSKAPKLYLTDTGLSAHVLGFGHDQLVVVPDRLGPLFEALVVTELVRQSGWSRARVRLYHFRTYSGQEVDVVLEAPDGRCVGIEVKLAATVTTRDVAGLRALADAAGSSFHRGIVLYTGHTVVPFAANLHAMPIDALWQASP